MTFLFIKSIFRHRNFFQNLSPNIIFSFSFILFWEILAYGSILDFDPDESGTLGQVGQVADHIPVIGHLKASFHALWGDDEAAQKSAINSCKYNLLFVAVFWKHVGGGAVVVLINYFKNYYSMAALLHKKSFRTGVNHVWEDFFFFNIFCENIQTQNISLKFWNFPVFCVYFFKQEHTHFWKLV